MGLLAGGPELVCDPECLWRETNLRGDRRSEIKTNDLIKAARRDEARQRLVTIPVLLLTLTPDPVTEEVCHRAAA